MSDSTVLQSLPLLEGIAMLNFLYCFVVLAVCGFVFRSLWRAFITPINRSAVLYNIPTGAPRFVLLLIQIYLVFGWAAICTNIAHRFANKPGALFWWGYYILAFFGCGAPLFDKTSNDTDTVFFFSIISFIAFSIYPILMLPWHWFLKFLF
jgi:NADH:ubiquinone oxidoreductase subunit 3 (subunit A)